MDAFKLKFEWHSEEYRYMPSPSVRRKLLLSSFSGVLWLGPSVPACMLSCFSCVQLFVRRSLCAWDSPGKNAGVRCHVLLQGTFLTQGSNPISYVSWTGRQVFTTSSTWEALCRQWQSPFCCAQEEGKSLPIVNNFPICSRWGTARGYILDISL